MTLEWAIFALLLAGALIPLGRRFRSALGWFGLLIVYGLALSSAGWWQGELRQKQKKRAEVSAKTPSQGRDGGYVSSDQCRSCHPDQHSSWHQSYHRTMTQVPSKASMRGNFNDVSLQLEGHNYHLKQRGEEYWVEMVDPDWRYVQTLKKASGVPVEETPNPPRVNKRVTLMTGSHHMQAYWVPSEFGNMQFSFPFTFLFEENRWVPRNDVFLCDPERPFTHQVWNTGCLNCHSTAGQPRQDQKTKVIESRTAELGIACEACHGPAEEHVRANRDPARRYALRRSNAPDPTIFNPARHDHIKSSETCGSCHAIRRSAPREEWLQHGTIFKPGGDIEAASALVRYDGTDLHKPGNEGKRALMEGSFWSDGQVRVSGREFNGLSASGCYTRGKISCLSCHSMHTYQSNDDQLSPRLEGNQACIQCHEQIGANLTRHTRHASGSSGSLCYNCHMPHTTYGLLKAIRSHTIDSPSVKASLSTGRPNACNLCHLDQTLDWTAQKLHDWYGTGTPSLNQEQKTVSGALTWMLKGDAGQRALVAWHFGWEPARKASGEAWMASHLAQLLADPYSAVRYVAQRSLKRLPGFDDFRYDYIAPLEQRKQAQLLAIERAGRNVQAPTNAAMAAALLLDGNGLVEHEKVSELLRRRNNRRMELLE